MDHISETPAVPSMDDTPDPTGSSPQAIRISTVQTNSTSSRPQRSPPLTPTSRRPAPLLAPGFIITGDALAQRTRSSVGDEYPESPSRRSITSSSPPASPGVASLHAPPLPLSLRDSSSSPPPPRIFTSHKPSSSLTLELSALPYTAQSHQHHLHHHQHQSQGTRGGSHARRLSSPETPIRDPYRFRMTNPKGVRINGKHLEDDSLSFRSICLRFLFFFLDALAGSGCTRACVLSQSGRLVHRAKVMQL